MFHSDLRVYPTEIFMESFFYNSCFFCIKYETKLHYEENIDVYLDYYWMVGT